jgi:hypothetical protein
VLQIEIGKILHYIDHCEEILSKRMAIRRVGAISTGAQKCLHATQLLLNVIFENRLHAFDQVKHLLRQQVRVVFEPFDQGLQVLQVGVDLGYVFPDIRDGLGVIVETAVVVADRRAIVGDGAGIVGDAGFQSAYPAVEAAQAFGDRATAGGGQGVGADY